MKEKAISFLSVVGVTASAIALVGFAFWAFFALMGIFHLAGIVIFFGWWYATLKVVIPIPGEGMGENAHLAIFSFIAMYALCVLA